MNKIIFNNVEYTSNDELIYNSVSYSSQSNSIIIYNGQTYMASERQEDEEDD